MFIRRNNLLNVVFRRFIRRSAFAGTDDGESVERGGDVIKGDGEERQPRRVRIGKIVKREITSPEANGTGEKYARNSFGI